MTRCAYLTMDTDWASDDVLSFVLDRIEREQLKVTIFLTHDTPLLARMRAMPEIRLGIHPNFYPQLENRADGDYRAVLTAMHALVPEAKVARAHGLVDATVILMALQELGFRADANLFIPFSAGIRLRPFKHFTGLTRLPFFYEDDAYTFETDPISPEDHLRLDPDGLKIFNFHPIHLFLNTETMARYRDAKPVQRDFARLQDFVNPSTENGAAAFLTRLVAEAERSGIRWDWIESLCD